MVLNIQEMESSIEIYLDKNNFKYSKLNNYEDINIIYNLFINDIIMNLEHLFFNDLNQIYYYYGIYYQIQNDFDNMIKYYLMAIEKNNSTAMNNLATFYEKQQNYDQMMKYYLMAIEKDNSTAMNNLADYYEKQQDYEQMIKYYLMAIEKNNSTAMNNLATYYFQQRNYDQMMKYFLMAIERGNLVSLCNLGSYYEKQNDFDSMIKYYLMAIEKGNSKAMNNLARYYEKHNDYENMMKYYLIFAETDNKYKDKINMFLSREKIPEYFKKAYNFLNDDNLKWYNRLLCFVINYDVNKIPFEQMAKIECVNCLLFTHCVFRKCGHSSCTNCHENNCRLCLSN